MKPPTDTTTQRRSALFAACAEMQRRLRITTLPLAAAKLEEFEAYLVSAYKLVKPEERIKVSEATCTIMRALAHADLRISAEKEADPVTPIKRNIRDWKGGKVHGGKKIKRGKRICPYGQISMNSYDMTFVAGAIDAVKKLLDKKNGMVYLTEVLAMAQADRVKRGLPLNQNLATTGMSHGLYALMHIGILDGDGISVCWSTEAKKLLKDVYGDET
jgi:hypothetical protein